MQHGKELSCSNRSLNAGRKDKRRREKGKKGKEGMQREMIWRERLGKRKKCAETRENEKKQDMD